MCEARSTFIGCFIGSGVASGGAAPPTLSYATPQSWTYGAAISTLSPTTTGATSFAVTTGALPTGVSLNTSTGDITGTPTAWAASGSFKVTATGAGGSTESGLVSWTLAFAPATFGTCLEWTKADGTLWRDSARTTAAVADADPVGAWDDESGNARHLLQATAGQRATLKLNVQNGLPGILADGVDDVLSVAVVKAQPVTIFVAGKILSANGPSAVFMYDAAGGPAIQKTHAGGTVWDIYAGAWLDGATATDELAHTFAAVFNGASSKLRLDAAEIASGDAGSAGLISIDLFGLALPMNGYIYEFLAYEGALSVGNIQSIEAYLKARWATP